MTLNIDKFEKLEEAYAKSLVDLCGRIYHALTYKNSLEENKALDEAITFISLTIDDDGNISDDKMKQFKNSLLNQARVLSSFGTTAGVYTGEHLRDYGLVTVAFGAAAVLGGLVMLAAGGAGVLPIIAGTVSMAVGGLLFLIGKLIKYVFEKCASNNHQVSLAMNDVVVAMKALETARKKIKISQESAENKIKMPQPSSNVVTFFCSAPTSNQTDGNIYGCNPACSK